MNGFIVGGVVLKTPFRVVTWRDDPRFRLVKPDVFPRAPGVVQLVGLHTTKGYPDLQHPTPQVVLDVVGPSMAANVAEAWSTSSSPGGAAIIIDGDRTVYQLCDLALEAASHIVGLNDRSIGIEYFQSARSELWRGQLELGVEVVDWLTRLPPEVEGAPGIKFAFQRQIPIGPYVNKALNRLTSTKADPPGRAGVDVVGVIGHRNASDNRGAGDPGDAIMQTFADAGYEMVIDERGTDRALWVARQTALGLTADGIPGPRTRAALEAAGHAHGLWIARPGDEAVVS